MNENNAVKEDGFNTNTKNIYIQIAVNGSIFWLKDSNLIVCLYKMLSDIIWVN